MLTLGAARMAESMFSYPGTRGTPVLNFTELLKLIDISTFSVLKGCVQTILPTTNLTVD
jgi:hypothetical protein